MLYQVFFYCFIVIIAVILIYTLYERWVYRSMRNIPGPISYPILGCALEIGLTPVDVLQDFIRLLKENYKERHVITAFIGPINKYLLIGDPELTEFFISSPKFIKKSVEYNHFRPWLANGLLTSTGSYWQKRRKAITPTFHFKILEQFVPVFNSQGNVLIKRLNEEVDKEVVDIYPFITAYTLDCICETAMGTTINAQLNPNNIYVDAVKTLCSIIIFRALSTWKQFDLLFKLSNDYKLQKKCLKIVHSFVRSVIEKRRKELMSDNSENINEIKNDEIGMKRKYALLDLLLNSTIDGKPLTDDDIAEEVNTFMFEGHDTTASGVAFALYELSKNPDVQNKVYAELYEIFGDDKTREPTMTDLNKMKYLELVIKESLRLYPSVPMFSRQLEEDVTHDGITYKKGLLIAFFIYYMQRREDLFKNATKFYPERFLPENQKTKNPFTYIAFSAGPRNCIGQKFAMYELKSCISKIIRNFELLPVDKKYDIVLSIEVILKSATGICVKLKKR